MVSGILSAVSGGSVPETRRDFLKKTVTGTGATLVAANIPVGGNDSFGRVSAAEKVSSKNNLEKETESILQEPITNVDEAVGFAVRHQLIAKEDINHQVKKNLKDLESSVKFALKTRDDSYAPDVFVKRLFLLKHDKFLNKNGTKAFLNHDNSLFAYGAAELLRNLVKDYTSIKESLPEEKRVVQEKQIRDKADTYVLKFTNKSNPVAVAAAQENP